jgi:cholesterol transport system auxiliary component
MKHLTLSLMALSLCAALGTSACALTSKADVVETRYFSPERVKPTLDSAAPPAPSPRGAIELRLGRVTSGTSLRERISYRDAAYELGYYEDFRWTERPDAYVRRGLGRTLFEEHGMHRVLGGSAPTLDVDVIAFDDLRLSTGRAARVQLKIVLFQDNLVILEDTLTIDQAVPGAKPKFEEVIAAMAMALDAASEQVTRKVETTLLARVARDK